MVHQIRKLPTLPYHPGLIVGTHMVVHNYLQLQLQSIHRKHMVYRHISGKTHT